VDQAPDPMKKRKRGLAMQDYMYSSSLVISCIIAMQMVRHRCTKQANVLHVGSGSALFSLFSIKDFSMSDIYNVIAKELHSFFSFPQKMYGKT